MLDKCLINSELGQIFIAHRKALLQDTTEQRSLCNLCKFTKSISRIKIYFQISNNIPLDEYSSLKPMATVSESVSNTIMQPANVLQQYCVNIRGC